MLLSRVANRIYWGARYLERAEDTARIVRSFTDLVADLPAEIEVSWESLVALAGSDAMYRERSALGPDAKPDDVEQAVVAHLVSDPRSASVRAFIASSRDNLRATREILPREAWEALNSLHLHTNREAEVSVRRSPRSRHLKRVLEQSRRIDGILASSMTHDESYVMWRLGRAIERADMTTRVLGVRAAAMLIEQESYADLPVELTNPYGIPPVGDVRQHDGIQWMGVLRSLTALQMFQRAVTGPIEGPAVVRFLLFDERFPRAVRCCLRELGLALRELPDPAGPLGALDGVLSALEQARSASTDGAMLDDAMDRIQQTLAALDNRIAERYLSVG